MTRRSGLPKETVNEPDGEQHRPARPAADGHEIGRHADGIEGNVALPDGRPVELGIFKEMGAPCCHLRLPGEERRSR